MQSSQTIVLGAGLVGMAVAYGLARQGHAVTVLDEGDQAFRASRGNFGLLWVQSKGYRMLPYAQWTRRSAALWPEFARMLAVDSGIDVQLRQPGGFQLCLSTDELEQELARLEWLRDAQQGDYPFECLEGAQLRRRLPGVGEAVVGACYSPLDGHVNPLKLLHALHVACQQWGVKVINGCHVDAIGQHSGGFELAAGRQRWRCEQLVLAAGLGNRALGAQLGETVPLGTTRGQILVSERLQPFLHFPTSTVRQTDEGTVQLGDSAESVGLDDTTSVPVMADIARRAVQSFPCLANVRLVRAWGALRVLTPDGAPIYQALSSAPGAWVVSCHSGVTLAAAHALSLARHIAEQSPASVLAPFSLQRFDPQREFNYAH